jgi:pantoate kinase
MLGANSNPLFYEQNDIDKAIVDLGTITNHGSVWGAMNISTMGEKYYKDIIANPSLENIMKTVGEFSNEDLENDTELKEIQEMV